ncbi:MAG: alpha/beta fold hydrolase [Rhizobiales bacterium]|nr:alpha/beta fold hydrolase [Hyphomicrobiales bacterium]
MKHHWHLDDSAETSAGRLACGRAGAPSRPPLVLTHGWPWSSFSWHRVIPALADRFHVHWYDMPGYGRSEMRPDQATGLNVQGAVFAEMLGHWGLREGAARPLVWAHDFGGATTLRAHLLHGAEYARLLLMNVVAMRPWGSSFFDHVRAHIDAFLGVPPHIHAAIVRAYIEGALVCDLQRGDVDALVAPWLTETGRISFWHQFAEADERWTGEVEPHYADIRCPAHVLWGKADPWIPLARGKALHGAIGAKGASVGWAVLEGVGHLPQLEAPDAVVAAAFEFFAGETR